MGNQESWHVQRAVGGWVVNHNWQDESGTYKNETHIFTDNEKLADFFAELPANQE